VIHGRCKIERTWSLKEYDLASSKKKKIDMGWKIGRVGIKGNDGNIARAKRKGKLPFNANIPHEQTLIRNFAETDNDGEKQGKFTMVLGVPKKVTP